MQSIKCESLDSFENYVSYNAVIIDFKHMSGILTAQFETVEFKSHLSSAIVSKLFSNLSLLLYFCQLVYLKYWPVLKELLMRGLA